MSALNKKPPPATRAKLLLDAELRAAAAAKTSLAGERLHRGQRGDTAARCRKTMPLFSAEQQPSEKPILLQLCAQVGAFQPRKGQRKDEQRTPRASRGSNKVHIKKPNPLPFSHSGRAMRDRVGDVQRNKMKRTKKERNRS